MAFCFKVILSIRKKEDDQPIYQKHDGERFTQPHTTKLNINTAYAVKIIIRPPVKLKDLILQGESLEVEESKHVDLEDDEEFGITYISHFDTTGYNLNKRKKRKELPITLVFMEGYSLMINLQCKLYPEKEVEHAHWGQVLTWLEYECKVEEGTSHVDVIREKYL